MNDQRLIEALRRLDRPGSPSTEFADRLFAQLVGVRRQPVVRLVPRRRIMVLAAMLALAALALAAVVGSELLRPRPALTIEGAWVIRTNPAGPSLRITYSLPPGGNVLVLEDSRYLSFTVGDRPYGFEANGVSGPQGHGVRIIDASTVRPHFNNNLPLGGDAAAFMDGLQRNQVLGQVIGSIRQSTLGGLPALTADLLPWRERVHMDTAHGLQVDLWAPSRLIVADLGSAIVFVQIWADSEAALASWLYQSRPFIDSLRIEAVAEVVPS